MTLILCMSLPDPLIWGNNIPNQDRWKLEALQIILRVLSGAGEHLKLCISRMANWQDVLAFTIMLLKKIVSK